MREVYGLGDLGDASEWWGNVAAAAPAILAPLPGGELLGAAIAAGTAWMHADSPAASSAPDGTTVLPPITIVGTPAPAPTPGPAAPAADAWRPVWIAGGIAVAVLGGAMLLRGRRRRRR